MDSSYSLLCAFILFIFLFLSLKMHSTKTKKLPPGPSPLPIFGNIFKLGTQPHKSLAELATTYGPIMTLKLGSVTTIVISSSKLAKDILSNPTHFSTPYALDAVYAHQHNKYSVAWLPASSPKWRALRRIYASLFSISKLDASKDLRHQKVVEMLDRVRKYSVEGFAVNISQMVLGTLFDIMLDTIISRDIGGHNPKEIKELVLDIIKETRKPNLVDCFPMLHLLDPQGIRRRLMILVKKLFKKFDDILGTRLRMRKEMKFASTTEDAMDVLLDAMEEQRDGFTRDFVLHTLLDLFGAAMDTTAEAVERALEELLNHPEILQRAQEELEKTIGKGKAVEESDISSLPYIQAVVKETLRLHPPVPLLLPRKIENNVEVHGYTIPKGSRMLVNIWAIGRDPENWVIPDSFEPDRLLDMNIDIKGQQFEMIPFSSGKRICPGMSLALRSIPTIVASMINCFDWKLEDGGDATMLKEEGLITPKKVKPLHAIPINRV